MKKLKHYVNNPQEYDKKEGDEIWLVLDTDFEIENPNLQVIENKKEILLSIRQKCKEQCWNVAQSNPCFEVWLYYHQESDIPVFPAGDYENIETAKNWKKHVSKIITGGFNSKKHFIFIEKAIKNPKAVFESYENGMPKPATTEVFLLAEKIYPFIKGYLEGFIAKMEEFTTKMEQSQKELKNIE